MTVVSEILDPFDRLLGDISAPAAVRAIEGGASAQADWTKLNQSGYLDALVSEASDGAGLTLAQVAPLFRALGRHAAALPVAETMVARAILVSAGMSIPDRPVILATLSPDGRNLVPFARVAEYALFQCGDRLALAKVKKPQQSAFGIRGSFSACVGTEDLVEPQFLSVRMDLRPLLAVVRATAIAGAAERLLEMTVQHANERIQFGKPIARQQAVQQQLAVMAEQVVAARIASEIGCAGGLQPALFAAATAKIVAGEAAVEVARIAHAVHGAIGISEEHDLHLFTRRLFEWRLADGSEAYWSALLGTERIDQNDTSSLDFIRNGFAVPSQAGPAPGDVRPSFLPGFA